MTAAQSSSQTERLHQIEHLLAHTPQGMRAGEIAEQLHISQAAVYRYLERLAESGMRLWQSGGRFGVSAEDDLPLVRLNFNEAMTLFIATRLLARYADEYNPHVVSALEKLAAALPPAIATHVLRTGAALRRRPADDRAVAVLEQITRAWAERRLVRLWYRSPHSGELRQRDLAPYFVEVSGPAYSCYVIGHDSWAGELRTFKLDRLERAQMLDQSYEIPPEFDADAFLAHSWGIMRGEGLTDVVLQFSPAVAALVRERTWHPSQILDELASGGLLFTVRVSEPREMRPWIRSWGADVEVLEPVYLRDQMKDEARRLADLYGIESQERPASH
jgi:predicted DNA-binding transcriptional regulator YafY